MLKIIVDSPQAIVEAKGNALETSYELSMVIGSIYQSYKNAGDPVTAAIFKKCMQEAMKEDGLIWHKDITQTAIVVPVKGDANGSQ